MIETQAYAASAVPDDTLDDSGQIIADLQRKLEERTAERDQYKAERDEAIAGQTATCNPLMKSTVMQITLTQ